MAKARKVQQALLVIIGLVLFFRFGIPGVVLGQGWIGPDSPPSTLLDSEARFLSALAIGLGAIVFSIIKTVEKHSTLVRIIALATLGGALVRVLSIAQHGMPPSRALAALGLELVFGISLLILQPSVTAKSS
jgi:hypothetical protein